MRSVVNQGMWRRETEVTEGEKAVLGVYQRE